jgi:two-component system chemotaxis response regulator CheB
VPNIRVLVVDDSVVVRRLVGDVLAADPEIDLVGTAANGRLALSKVEQLRPDIVTMDVEMPELDGVEAVRQLRRSGNRVPVIMFSTLTDPGATATLDALAAGATDYVTKPANVGSIGRSMEQVRSSLIPKIKGLAGRPAVLAVPGPAAAPVPAAPPRPARSAAARVATGGCDLLVVGCSTGGPEALTTFLSSLPGLSVPVAVVQHMPAVFTQAFATRLDRSLRYDVTEATQGQVLRPGTVTVAPGGHHLHVTSAGGALVVRLSQEPPENYCRPAVDVLFRSAAGACQGRVLGVVLTGMGQDGCRGSAAIVEAGGTVLAQDRQTSVVWGMPGAVAGAGLAEEVLPLAALGAAVGQRLAPLPGLTGARDR